MARVNRTTGVFLVLGVVVLIVSVSAAWFMESQGQRPTQALTEPSDEKLDVIGRGLVDVRSRLSHPSPSPHALGVVAAVEVKEGQRVSKDQVLLRLDDTTARSELKLAKDSVDLAKRDVGKAQLAVEEHKAKVVQQDGIVSAAKTTWNQAQKRYENAKKHIGLSSNAEPVEIAELDELKAHNSFDDQMRLLKILKNTDPNVLVAIAEENVKGAESRVKEIEKALENYIVRAPTKGRVFRLNVSVGDLFAMPAPNMEPRITFCPDDELIVRAEINQENALRVLGGEQVEITLHGPGSGKSYSGRVESVSHWVTRPRSAVYEPDQINDARFRECLIRFDTQPDEKELVVGTRLRVRIKMN